jgi:tetratricopeptide (TPR) repeat protein
MNQSNPQMLFQQAAQFHRQGQLAAAERIYQQLITLLPMSAEPRHFLGVLRLQQGRFEDALNLIAAALRIDPRNPEALVNHGHALKSLRRFEEAAAAYDRALAVRPDFAGAHFNRALVLQELKRHEEALVSYDKVLSLNPNAFEVLYNRGLLLMDMGRDTEAATDLQKATRLRPEIAEGWNNLGTALSSLGRWDDALASFDRALSLRPDFVSAIYNRANLLQDRMGRLSEALELYDRALALAPDFAEAWNNRGNVLREMGRLDEAFASYDRALAIKPDQPDAWKGRAQLYFEIGRTMEGIEAFMRATGLLYGPVQAPPMPGLSTPPHKASHDLEQIAYLESVKGRFSEKAGGRRNGPAVKPDNHVAEISEEWRTKKPQIAVIDNLLTPEALEGLRRFCLETPSWRDAYPNGYLGAMPLSGFACPLLGQIADELVQTFPAIFKNHPLLYMWGFKYDSRLSGIALHGDQAAVNVNFWITPDDANLDPERGGLVIWDAAAPLEWDFAKMNSDNRAIRDFLASRNAKPVRVPYRQNRAVIFDSDLFHETDTIHFKEGYLNRRVNVTMLFGRRERPSS